MRKPVSWLLSLSFCERVVASAFGCCACPKHWDCLLSRKWPGCVRELDYERGGVVGAPYTNAAVMGGYLEWLRGQGHIPCRTLLPEACVR
jgi:hypothetical protein